MGAKRDPARCPGDVQADPRFEKLVELVHQGNQSDRSAADLGCECGDIVEFLLLWSSEDVVATQHTQPAGFIFRVMSGHWDLELGCYNEGADQKETSAPAESYK